jgi:hypothetical protein
MINVWSMYTSFSRSQVWKGGVWECANSLLCLHYVYEYARFASPNNIRTQVAYNVNIQYVIEP